LLVCDDRIAIVGGFNVAPEYEGDGVTRGWCDLGISLSGPLVKELEASFQEMFARADFTRRFFRFPHASGRRTVGRPAEQLLLSAPGISRSPIKRALSKDFSRAADVRMIIAYFLPSLRMRRRLARIARRGGRVQLILAGKTDVLVSQLAARS
jgi:cardiolipin synthase